MAFESSNEKQYELFLLSLTHNYLGMSGENYIKFMPDNKLGLDGFFSKPYIAQVAPYKTEMLIRNNINQAMMNLVNIDSVNQLTNSTLGETFVDDYYKQLNNINNFEINVNLNVKFKMALIAYIEEILVMYDEKAKAKLAGACASTTLDLCEDKLMDEDFALNAIKEAFPKQAAEVKLEDVLEGKASLKSKLLKMKNNLVGYVKEKQTQVKEFVESEEFEEAVDNTKQFVSEKFKQVKQKLEPTVTKLKFYAKASKDRITNFSKDNAPKVKDFAVKTVDTTTKVAKQAFITAKTSIVKAAKRIVAFVPKTVEKVSDTAKEVAKTVTENASNVTKAIKGKDETIEL